MAWQCTGATNTALITNLHKAGIVTDMRVVDAMKKMDRKFYCPTGANPYEDSPQGIGHNVTISAPHMHAMCLECLSAHLKPGMRGLDVGSGTGYFTVAMALMVGASGKAVGVEHVPQLVITSIENIKNDGKTQLLESGSVLIKEGDGRLGVPEHGPYDAIHVGAAAPSLPRALVEQLKPGGRLIIPVGVNTQELLQVDKGPDGRVTQKSLTGVRYVPLTDLSKQVTGK
mmetsp:Transcript_95345/g.139228  ORF Transcript_95345/g.139228 Transcript_95345/m.139228 type:complete len:228 (+) Transcript_95345:141-824(+)|eukprot:CAMPEP_0179439090 /NCGR_PEP_ID=MMETSP0799-20121207/22740_1 /TAXON_ID=46947 /ORGANISM="Geminigera cryophila, Strain CCMP2564" /LENGTH=227 /DNA_ID=CAMNT_0021221193 /DNA_START=150 /DNA_END=833 /DNA_ORIENTATION=-